MSLEEAKKYLGTKYYKDSCTGYTVLLANGNNSGYHSTACYGGLRVRAVLDNDVVAIVNQLQTEYHSTYNALPKGTAKKYLDWLVNRSVFSHTFFEKDVDKILEEEIWVTRCDIPGNVMVAAMTCLRALTENDRSCKSAEVFLPLVEAGCSEEFAFVLGHYMNGSHLRTDAYDSHHCMFNFGDLTTTTVVNFLKGNITKPRVENWDKDKSYAGVHDLFFDHGSAFSPWLAKTYKAVKNGTQELEKKSTNPFQVNNLLAKDGLRMEEDRFEVMAKVYDLFCKEFMK